MSSSAYSSQLLVEGLYVYTVAFYLSQVVFLWRNGRREGRCCMAHCPKTHNEQQRPQRHDSPLSTLFSTKTPRVRSSLCTALVRHISTNPPCKRWSWCPLSLLSNTKSITIAQYSKVVLNWTGKRDALHHVNQIGDKHTVESLLTVPWKCWKIARRVNLSQKKTPPPYFCCWQNSLHLYDNLDKHKTQSSCFGTLEWSPAWHCVIWTSEFWRWEIEEVSALCISDHF